MKTYTNIEKTPMSFHRFNIYWRVPLRVVFNFLLLIFSNGVRNSLLGQVEAQHMESIIKLEELLLLISVLIGIIILAQRGKCNRMAWSMIVLSEVILLINCTIRGVVSYDYGAFIASIVWFLIFLRYYLKRKNIFFAGNNHITNCKVTLQDTERKFWSKWGRWKYKDEVVGNEIYEDNKIEMTDKKFGEKYNSKLINYESEEYFEQEYTELFGEGKSQEDIIKRTDSSEKLLKSVWKIVISFLVMIIICVMSMVGIFYQKNEIKGLNDEIAGLNNEIMRYEDEISTLEGELEILQQAINEYEDEIYYNSFREGEGSYYQEAFEFYESNTKVVEMRAGGYIFHGYGCVWLEPETTVGAIDIYTAEAFVRDNPEQASYCLTCEIYR